MGFLHIQKFNDSYRLLLWCSLVCEMRMSPKTASDCLYPSTAYCQYTAYYPTVFITLSTYGSTQKELREDVTVS